MLISQCETAGQAPRARLLIGNVEQRVPNRISLASTGGLSTALHEFTLSFFFFFLLLAAPVVAAFPSPSDRLTARRHSKEVCALLRVCSSPSSSLLSVRRHGPFQHGQRWPILYIQSLQSIFLPVLHCDLRSAFVQRQWRSYLVSLHRICS